MFETGANIKGADQFGALVQSFLTHLGHTQKRSKHTINAYKNDLMLFHSYAVEKTMSQFTMHSFDSLVAQYTPSLHRHDLSRASIARKISCFSTFQRFLIAQGLPSHITLKRPLYEHKKPNFLSKELIVSLIDTLSVRYLSLQHPQRDKTILELLFATGARCSELVTIKLDDINLSEQYIILYDSKKILRRIDFQDRTRRQIELYLRTERAQNKLIRTLLLNNRQESFTCRGIQRTLKIFESALGSDYCITPHTIRHSYAVSLMEQGKSIVEIQHALGFRTRESAEKYLHCTKIGIYTDNS